MNTETNCLGCGEPFDWSEEVCPDCGWDRSEWIDRDRHGLAKEGHGEPESDSSDAGMGSGIGGLGPIR